MDKVTSSNAHATEAAGSQCVTPNPPHSTFKSLPSHTSSGKSTLTHEIQHPSQSQSKSAKPLPYLPPEIIQRILTHLPASPRSERLNTLYVCRTWHELALPLIYHTLYLDLSTRVHALSCLIPEYEPRGSSSGGEEGKGKGVQTSGKGKGEDLSAMVKLVTSFLQVSVSSIKLRPADHGKLSSDAGDQLSHKTGGHSRATATPPPWIPPNRFQHLTTLILYAHHSFLCAKLRPAPETSTSFYNSAGALDAAHDHLVKAPLILTPNLDTLRIYPSHGINFLDCCVYVSGDSKAPKPGRPCPLLLSLQPRRLELGGRHTGLTRCGGFVWNTQTSQFPPRHMIDRLKEITVNAGPCSGIEIEDGRVTTSKSAFLHRIPASVELLSIVMYPQTEGKRWNYRRVAGYEGRIVPSFLWDGLGLALSGDAKKVEMAGLESVDRDWSEMTIKMEEEAIRDAMRKVLIERKVDKEEIKRKVDRVRFISLKQYEEWG